MINENKIKSAAQAYCDATYGTLDNHSLIADAFKQGAKWAIDKFLKDLWHPYSEEPNIEEKPILFNCIDHDCVPSWCVYPIGFNGNWKVFYISHGITKWLYIDDLLLK